MLEWDLLRASNLPPGNVKIVKRTTEILEFRGRKITFPRLQCFHSKLFRLRILSTSPDTTSTITLLFNQKVKLVKGEIRMSLFHTTLTHGGSTFGGIACVSRSPPRTCQPTYPTTIASPREIPSWCSDTLRWSYVATKRDKWNLHIFICQFIVWHMHFVNMIYSWHTSCTRERLSWWNTLP